MPSATDFCCDRTFKVAVSTPLLLCCPLSEQEDNGFIFIGLVKKKNKIKNKPNKNQKNKQGKEEYDMCHVA